MRTRIAGLMILTIILGCYHTSWAQIYAPSKVCIQNPAVPSPTGTNDCQETVNILELSPNPGGSDTWTWTVNGIPTPETSRYLTYDFSTFTPGTYTISSTPSSTGIPNQKNIDVAYYPTQPTFVNNSGEIVKDTTICGGTTITLDPFEHSSAPSNVSYKWFPDGDKTTSTIDVDEAGCYTVEVIDNVSGCSRFAKINVKVCYEEPPTTSSNEKWYFGHGSGLEFTFTGTSTMPDPTENTGSLDPQPEITNPSFDPSGVGVTDLRADEAVAQVLDKNRNIVLYTDGKKLFSGEDDTAIPLLSGTDFTLPDNAGTQGLALVPKPVCSACDFIFHYLFAVDKTTGILSYSVVDMRENDKKGEVTEENVPVAVGVFDKLAVERSADDLSYFITAFSQETNSFIGFTIDSLGVKTTQLATSTITTPNVSQGYIAVSADGTQLAHGLIENGENQIEIFTRDPATNELNSPKIISLGADDATVYGLAFSPNGQFLYVTLKGDGSTIDSRLIQIDLTTDAFEEIGSSSTLVFGALGLGPKYGDGRKYVYLTTQDKGAVHYLQDPNVTGKDEVGFTLNQSGHPGTQVPGTTKLGFPNVVAPKPSDDGSGLGVNYIGNCFGVPTELVAQEICDPLKNDFEWRVEGKKHSGKSVNHTFSRVGWHDVELIVKVYKERKVAGVVVGKDHCTEVPFKGRIYIKPSPVLTIPDPLYICMLPFDGSSPRVKLDTKPTGGDSFTFEWLTSTGITLANSINSPIFEFTAAQNYRVRATNNFACETESPIRVEPGCSPEIHIPNVITPDGSGPAVNEDLIIINHYIDRPVLEIYNRWGDMVFKTEDLKNDRWDGKVNGKIYPGQVYPYVLKYYARDFMDRGQQKITGSVLVLGK